LIRLYFVTLWSIIDPIYYALTRLHYIQSETKSSVFRVRLTKYKGKDITLKDGTNIYKNDLLIKIHLHNVRLLKEVLTIQNPVNRGKIIYRAVYNSMPDLAKYIEKHPNRDQIKGIIGITMLNKGVRHLGFECHYPENMFYIWLKKLTQLPIYFMSSSFISFQKFKNQKPTYLFMSKDKLTKKYLHKIPSTNSH